MPAVTADQRSRYDDIATALAGCDWSDTPIGNKAIVLAAIDALGCAHRASLTALQRQPFEHLARQFDLMAKGCRAHGLDSWEDELDSHRQAAMRGEVDADYIVRMIHYNYETNQDGRAAAKLLVDALCKDLLAQPVIADKREVK